MERVEVLLEKLRMQWREEVPREQLMLTLHMLQEEMLLQRPPSQPETKQGKVSVILPRGLAAMSTGVQTLPAEEKIVQVLQVSEDDIEAELKQIKEAADLKNDLSLKARSQSTEPATGSLEDIPTMASHLSYLPKEPVKPEQIIENGSRAQAEVINAEDQSLNDKLKNSAKELADHLQGAPVKDLKKAIGINDRYLYINELFQGNEAMFDRTLKTINAFTILPEAEYWIQRELRIKLGWNDEDPVTKQFVQLVRRRFS